MKKRNTRLISALLCVVLALSIILTGCGGKDGVGIKRTRINDKGELIITYTNGKSENLGVVVGQNGEDGQDGADGEDGQNGEDGQDGQNGNSMLTGNVAAAASVALRSAVSIYCTFQEPGRYGTEYYSAGSGVIYQLDKEKGDAIIITNHHVVYDVDSSEENGISKTIEVYLYGSELEGYEMVAEYVGGSQYYDIAVLHISGSDVLKQSDAIAVTVADSDEVAVGQTAIAVGNAEGEGITTTSGIISVDSEHITMTAADNATEISYRVMRVDTAVNHGNSGGGLYNDKGQLIGIVNAKIIDDEVENIGYAIPTRVAIGVAENILDYCFETDCESVMRAMLGVTIINKASRAVYDKETGLVRIEEAIEVYEVSSGSIANGKLEVGDILLSVELNGQLQMITRQHHVIDLMLHARAGDTMKITVLRDGKEKTFSVNLTEDCITAY